MQSIQHSEFYRGIIDSMLEHIALIDLDGKILLVNRAWNVFARENGDPELRTAGAGANYLDVCRQSARLDPTIQLITDGIQEVLTGRRDRFIHEYPCHAPDERRWFLMHVTLLEHGQELAVINHINITQRREAEEERERLIRQLQTALAEVKTLGGLLPICADCKKIRDDQGYWKQLERYLSDHTEATFSHGFCPDCYQKRIGDLGEQLARMKAQNIR